MLSVCLNKAQSTDCSQQALAQPVLSSQGPFPRPFPGAWMSRAPACLLFGKPASPSVTIGKVLEIPRLIFVHFPGLATATCPSHPSRYKAGPHAPRIPKPPEDRERGQCPSETPHSQTSPSPSPLHRARCLVAHCHAARGWDAP